MSRTPVSDMLTRNSSAIRLERLGDAGLAHGGEAVEIGAADQAAARAERQRLQHVLPGAHAAVEQYLDAVADGIGDARQRRDGRGRAVELAAAVIGHHDGVGAEIGGLLARPRRRARP